MIAIIEYTDEDCSNIRDEQEWLYDKENKIFVSKINIFVVVRFYFVIDDYFIFNRIQLFILINDDI